jgi:protocatechuate 3,4-dioxygenase beta subunit
LVQLLRVPAHRASAQGERSTAPAAPFAASTFTGATGQFRFESLAAGNYFLSAQKPQFHAEDAARRHVELTASVEDIALKLTPLSVIAGEVVDQNGEPLRGVNVIAMSSAVEDGLRQTRTNRTASTDDRGLYRFWNMQPGKYFIKAAGWSGSTYLYAGDTSPQLFADESFAPTYFGGGSSLESATPVQIEAGTEANASISIKLEPAFKIRGSLANYVPRHTVKFELLRGDEDVSSGRVSVNGDTGRFEVHYVASGAYILRATQDEASAEVPVNVTGTDAGGVTLTLAGGVDVKGTVRVISQTASSPPSGGQPLRGISPRCAVALHPAGMRAGKTYASTRGEGDDITIRGVMPGLYRVSVTCYGAYVQSAVSGAQDLLENRTLTVPPGGVPPTIEVIARQGGGRIQGKLTIGPSLKQDRLQVLLVPQFASAAGPVLVRVYGRPDITGSVRFYANALAPGAYTAYAFLNADDLEYRNPSFVRTLSGGVGVQVEDGSEKNVTIADVIQ